MDLEPEQRRAFRTHACYLKAFRYLAFQHTTNVDLSALASRAESEFQYLKVKPVGSINPDAKTSLGRAWSAELLLNATGELVGENEMVKIANSWAVVQAYYALHGVVQAFLISSGLPKTSSHTTTQKQFLEAWGQRGAALAPWSLRVGHPGGKGLNESGLAGSTGSLVDLNSHPWATWDPANAESLAFRSLKGTRAIKVDEKLKEIRATLLLKRQREWDERNARQLERRGVPLKAPRPSKGSLTDEDKKAHASKVRCSSMMDYLYRLRIKANYEDASMYNDGPETVQSARAFADDLRALTMASSLVHEMRIIRAIGQKNFIDVMSEWLDANPGNYKFHTVRARYDLLR